MGNIPSERLVIITDDKIFVTGIHGGTDGKIYIRSKRKEYETNLFYLRQNISAIYDIEIPEEKTIIFFPCHSKSVQERFDDFEQAVENIRILGGNYNGNVWVKFEELGGNRYKIIWYKKNSFDEVLDNWRK